jgi:hypothetical protein
MLLLLPLLLRTLYAGASAQSNSRKPRTPTTAELRRPSSTFQQPGWSPTADQYYAIGNTRGFDITGGLLPASGSAAAAESAVAESAGSCAAAGASAVVPSSIRILLAGCGDVRNLLATVAGMQPPCAAAAADTAITASNAGSELGSSSSSSSSQHTSCDFVLNDGNTSMLARDAVMLHTAAELAAPPEAVLAVWANQGLSEAHWQLLQRSCKALAEEPWPAWLTASSALTRTSPLQQQQQGVTADSAEVSQLASAAQQRSDAEQQVRAVCAAWASCSISLSEMLQMREGVNASSVTFATAVQLSLSALSSSSSSSSYSKNNAALEKEVRSYIRDGSLPAAFSSGSSSSSSANKQQQQTRANPTFLLGTALQYTVYFLSSIYRAVELAPESPGCTSAAQRLLAAVRPQLAAAAAGLHGGWLKVHLVPGDVLTAATAASSSSTGASNSAAARNVEAELQLFDYIDTSNVSDYT